MRIISGEAKGRKLFTPGKGAGIRPTSDRAREALFSIIGKQVRGACVLDLYCGTGAFGLEAFSRGATTTIFVDSSRAALELSKKNAALCFPKVGQDGAAEKELLFLRHDLRNKMPTKLKNLSNNCVQGIDLLFLDPPYGVGLAEKTLQDIDQSLFCSAQSLIIAEEKKTVTLPERFPKQLVLQDQRRYGDTRFWFYTPL